jgi:hypothetical protein
MPHSFDPTTPLELVLDDDREKTPQPTFFAKNLSTRDWLQFAKDYIGVINRDVLIDQVTGVYDLLRANLVGWREVGGKFNPNNLEDVLHPTEAMELLGHIYRSCCVSPDDKKKFESPPSSNSGNSAETAAAGARTRRQN